MYQEFVKLYRQCLMTEDLRKKYARKVFDSVQKEEKLRSDATMSFAKYDADNSGEMDVAELQNVLMDLLDVRLDATDWAHFMQVKYVLF